MDRWQLEAFLTEFPFLRDIPEVRVSKVNHVSVRKIDPGLIESSGPGGYLSGSFYYGSSFYRRLFLVNQEGRIIDEVGSQIKRPTGWRRALQWRRLPEETVEQSIIRQGSRANTIGYIVEVRDEPNETSILVYKKKTSAPLLDELAAMARAEVEQAVEAL